MYVRVSIAIILIASGVLIGVVGYHVWSTFEKESELTQNYTNANGFEEEGQSTERVNPLIAEFVFDDKLFASDQAIEKISEHADKLNEEKRKQFNKALVNYAETILRDETKVNIVETRLQRLREYADTEKRINQMLLEFFRNHKQNESLFTLLYEMRALASSSDDFNRVQLQINQELERVIIEAEQKKDFVILRSLFQFLIKTDPADFALQLKYATFEYEQKNYEKVNSLLAVLEYTEYQSEARKLKDMIESQRLALTFRTAELRKHGENYVVKVVINNQQTLNLMIDTGASVTVLKSELRDLISSDHALKFLKFSTANGIVEAPVYQISLLEVSDFGVHDLEVALLPLAGSDEIDGLLGMNYLGQFEFFIDQKNMLLTLNPRR